jgi:hypothetical protein
MSELLDEWVRAMRESDYESAWAVNERQAASRLAHDRDDPALPYHLRWVWDRRDPTGRDVLVRCYHGLGDTIQFLRFLPELRRRAASVTLEIQPRLIALLGESLPAWRIVPFDVARPLPPADCDIEIMELCFALRMRPGAAPPPYLHAVPAPLAPGTIGLCASAGDWDQSRSIPAELLAPICEGRPCVTLDPRPTSLPVRNPDGCPYDMVETAALVSGASLVITVDTMIAHLAGAMNKPTWLLLKHDPDWRWTPRSGRSEWYPSMRLYAQPSPGDWPEVVRAVARDLDALIPKRSLPHESRPSLPSRPGVLGRAARQDHHPADQE